MREILFTSKRTDDGESCHKKKQYKEAMQV